jgi:hypothetical protein
MSEEKTKAFALPAGRLINESLFVKDVYKDEDGKEGTPKYKVELVFPKDTEGLRGEGTDAEPTVEDKIYDAVVEEWGEKGADAFEAGEVRLPFIDGDVFAEDRVDRGKKGDAYVGNWIIRADTIYNLDGDIESGGISVYDEELEPIAPANRKLIYRGCEGIAGVTIYCYKDSVYKKKCVKFYLSAFQKSSDGERISSGGDKSSLFSKLGKEKKKTSSRRRAARA